MSETITLLPISFQLDDFVVTILEVQKLQCVGKTWFHVTVRLQNRWVKTRQFGLDVKDMEELKDKLRVEISKLKMMRYTLGDLATREVVA